MYFKTALQSFNHISDIAKGKIPPTQVIEIDNSHPLTTVREVVDKLFDYPTNTPIWQHDNTNYVHIAAERIKKGTGLLFNRSILNLYADSKLNCQTETAFRRLWKKTNNTLRGEGKLPNATSQTTSDVRTSAQKSLIIANQDIGRLPSDPYKGKNVGVDRTHLIPATVTGVEVSPGLIIDFNSQLNRNEMRQFEQETLRYNRNHSIIWITRVAFNSRGLLTIKYIIISYNENEKTGKIIREARFTDKTWDYLWFRQDED